ncbi:hypothetical protein [Pseudomonas sp. S2_D10]
MKSSDIEVIKNVIAPRVAQGDISLLLGAGFSIVNQTAKGPLPGGDALRDLILAECGKTAGKRTSLKDAYQLGSREIPNFANFLASCFMTTTALDWQKKYFTTYGAGSTQRILTTY